MYAVNSPCSVGICASAVRSTRCSRCRRCSIRSAIKITLRWCSSATRMSSGRRAIEPSGWSTSHSTPAGYRPASRARSTVASVCPARLRTPPCCAISGKTWPGIRMSSGRRSGSAIDRTVAARSNALVPVVVRPCTSIETANAVPWLSLFFETMSGIRSSSSRCWVIGMQTIPRPCVTMKFRLSGVAFSAAMMKSPSFSRSASSTTITIFPVRMSASASSIVANTGSLPSVMTVPPGALPRTSRSRRPPGSRDHPPRPIRASSPRACAGSTPHRRSPRPGRRS